MVDRLMDSQSIFNYAKQQFGSSEKANRWMFSNNKFLNNQRPMDVVLSDDVDGFKKCVEAVDKEVLSLH